MIFPIGQSRARIGVAALRAIAQSVVKDLGGVRLFSRVVVRGDRTKERKERPSGHHRLAVTMIRTLRTRLNRKLARHSAPRVYATRGSDALLASLREAGFTPIESIQILAQTARVSLGEAKRELFASSTWKDQRENWDTLHERLELIVDGKASGRGGVDGDGDGEREDER